MEVLEDIKHYINKSMQISQIQKIVPIILREKIGLQKVSLCHVMKTNNFIKCGN